MKKLLIITLAVLSLSACNAKPENVADTAPTPEQQVNFVLPNVNGGQWDFNSQLTNKPVLVAYMATFCGFCKKMAPYIDEIAGKYNAKGVETVIVFVDEAEATPKEFAKTHQVKHAKVLYNGGSFAQEGGVRGFPHMVLFDNKSEERAQWGGYNPEYVDVISSHIDNMLAGQ